MRVRGEREDIGEEMKKRKRVAELSNTKERQRESVENFHLWVQKAPFGNFDLWVFCGNRVTVQKRKAFRSNETSWDPLWGPFDSDW